MTEACSCDVLCIGAGRQAFCIEERSIQCKFKIRLRGGEGADALQWEWITLLSNGKARCGGEKGLKEEKSCCAQLAAVVMETLGGGGGS
jgi:hypothetical protein